MSYYFIRNATTAYGPIHFPLYVLPQETIKTAVGREAGERKIIVCHDWTAEPISLGEYREIAGVNC